MMRLNLAGAVRSCLLIGVLGGNASALAGAPECPVSRFDLGDHTFTISTASKAAQEYFDQGINWTYGFNHAEAIRNFRAAIALDPNCAMCYWGIAFALGPNINAPMSASNAQLAFAELQNAVALRARATTREQAYIDALQQRYAETPVEDRSALDLAFAKAMGAVSAQFPADLDAATLYAEALMDTMPWHYWDEQGQARAGTEEMLASLEKVLAANPQHPGANHYYIHVLEAHDPERAADAADRLLTLVPDAGHLVHMPSHIYLRTGRYQDAVESNQLGIAADARYMAHCHPQSLYIMMYVPHNFDFLVAAAALQGQSQLALKTAADMTTMMTSHLAHAGDMVDVQQFWITHLMNLVRFGKWDAVLEWAEPHRDHLYARGLYHYARAIALIRRDQMSQASEEIEQLNVISDDPTLEHAMVMGLNSASNVLKIGVFEARGEWHAAEGHFAKAVDNLSEAVKRQDELLYIEPPSWYHSTRLALGAVLLQAKNPIAAEEVFREDLVDFPGNGWALRGLAEALKQQGDLTEATSVERAFADAWQRADFELRTPRL